MKISTAVVPRGDHFVALAVVRSLGKKNIRTTVISDAEYALTFYSRYCTRRILSGKSMDCYSALAEEDLVMPTEEQTMLELAKNRNRYACRLAFPDYRTLDFTFNKRRVLDRARELGIPCPVSSSFESGNPPGEQKFSHIPFPAVVKPVHSLGGVGITFAETPAQLDAACTEAEKKFGAVLIQEKIPYEERYSVAALMNSEHQLRRCCVLRALRCYPLQTGPASFVESVDRPDLLSMSERLLESIQFEGVAEVEFVIDKRDNTPKLMEINPRFWGSLQGAISSGVDFPALLYELYTRGDVEKDLTYKIGIRTRNIIPYEFHRLTNILWGQDPVPVKMATIAEFLKIYDDDAHFIFSWDDIRPFLSLFSSSLRKRSKKYLRAMR